MKKKTLLIVGLVALFGLGITSCKKDCKCKAYYGSEHISSLDMSSTTKKKDCKDYTTTVQDYDEYYGQNVAVTVKMECSWGN